MRGLDILFAPVRPCPDWLVEKLVVDGEGTINHEPFQYAGTIEGLTSHPAIYAKPATVKLEVRGATHLLVDAVLDRTQDVPYDRIAIECPEMSLPKRTWGKAERMAVAVSPGVTRTSLVVHLRGEELLGRLTLRQEALELRPSLGEAYGGSALAADLGEALARIRSVEVAADLSGSLEQPQWRVRSDLGPQLAEAFNWLVQHEIETRRDEVAQYVRQRLEKQTARLEETLKAKEREVLAKADLNLDDLGQLRGLLGGVPMPGNLSLDRLPLPDSAQVDRLTGRLADKLGDKLNDRVKLPGDLKVPDRLSLPSGLPASDPFFGKPAQTGTPRRY
jgi:hypothetical protein